ncbi:MAG TPA: VOC family protein [Steroidobacteraceae bacterium]|jgi:methylmalonyl-CoA/ethylmalonyl-CoA epimerase
MSSPLEFWHHHGAMSVPDIEAAVVWWDRILDFKLLKRFRIAAIPAEVAMLQNGPLHIELFELAAAKPLPPERREPDTDLLTHGNKHVSFAVHDVETFAQELKRRGADIVWVRKMPHGSNIFIRDLAGNLIEFVAEPKPEAHMGLLKHAG